MVKSLIWDSNFFGLRIGRTNISSKEECVALANQKKSLAKNYDLVYVFSSHGLKFSGDKAKLVDQKVVYSVSKDVSAELNPNIEIWDGNKGVTDDLLYLALVSGKYSRFKMDEQFLSGSYERLYSSWIEQSVSGVIASEVFCYMVDGVPIGLVTLNRKAEVGTIGLVAIHDKFQHRGIGTIMMQHVIRYAIENQCKKLSVATQLENVPACKLYENNGFEVEYVTDVWHWWL